MFNVSSLLLDDALSLKPVTPLIAPLVSDVAGLSEVVLLVHGQVTIIFVMSVCLFVCLFVCAEFFSAVFDPISI